MAARRARVGRCPSPRCSSRCRSGRSRCPTASSRPRTRPVTSTTTCPPTTSSPTTRRGPAAPPARCSSRRQRCTPTACSPRTRSAATCPRSPRRTGGWRRRPRPRDEPVRAASAQRGREQIASAPRPPAIAPSAVPSPRFHSEPRALTTAEIAELVAGYAACARLCRDEGVDGIEVSMAHGYLAAQFFASATNRRDDAYNGELGARLRFAREVLAAVRAEAGGSMAVGVRLAADEIAPETMGPAECAEVAAALCAGGAVDFVSAALGHSGSHRGSTYIVPPPPEPVEAIARPVAPMRAALPGVPLIATSRVVDLEGAARLVASGAVDAVGMTRALIAEPDRREGAGRALRRRGAVHRLQPGLHRPLPRRGADRLPDEPAHRARGAPPLPRRARRRRPAPRLLGAERAPPARARDARPGARAPPRARRPRRPAPPRTDVRRARRRECARRS
ncbi:MAG TPA: hypothetical protein VHF51_13585 [Solirubrobacteraceae bacterium]|nr:hypothetical protein [Solirubrobacteraceae bacterium]